MRVPFVGPSYQMDARSFDFQRSINLFPIVSESGTSKSISALRSTPGLSLFTTAGTGPIRAEFTSSNTGRCFVVSGNEFYEVFNDGTSNLINSLDTNISRCYMAENNAGEVMIVDGLYGYIFDMDTDTFTKITDVDFPATPVHLTYQDGYFIVPEGGTQKVYISGINDGLTWGALDFTSVESSPDNLIGCISTRQNLWLFGTRATEVYQNTGNAAFPFERIGGAVIQTGCADQGTIQEIDNTVFWLGQDGYGSGVVWANNGYNAQRISTQAIEARIASAADFTDSYAWVYHDQGHAFYCLQVRTLDTTLVYDVSTQQWHERSYKNATLDAREQHLGSCHTFAFNKHLVGSRKDGKIYELSLNYYSDNGDELVRERISPVFSDGKKLVNYSSFELDCENGVGLSSGQGSDPQVMMRYSNNNGYTWSNERFAPLGKQGVYGARTIWRRLGTGLDRVFWVTYSDPTFFQINAAYVNEV